MIIDQTKIVSTLIADGFTIKKNLHGNSMIPAIPDNSPVSISPVTPRDVRIGDVVLINSNGVFLVHRVVRRFVKEGFRFIQTWGDNNLIPDLPVEENKVIGKNFNHFQRQ